MSLTPEQIASLKAQVEAHKSRQVRAEDRVVECEECGRLLGTHRWRVQNGARAYGGFHLAPGMVALGKRTFGPPAAARVRKRTPIMAANRIPPPVTVRCLTCRSPRVIDTTE